MPLRQMQLYSSKNYLEKHQNDRKYAVGVLPIIGDDVLLMKRSKEPFAGKYSIITGKQKMWKLDWSKTDWYSLYLARNAPRIEGGRNWNKTIEGREWTAMRELYEEIYGEKKGVIRTLNSRKSAMPENIGFERLKEEMDIVDSTTGYIISVFSLPLVEPVTNPENDARLLSDIPLEEMNPLTQFVLLKSGKIRKTTYEMKYSKVNFVKGLNVWAKRDNAYTLSY